jgi:(2Fe-2S) ferredoxin
LNRKRFVLCMGVYCNLGRRADTLYKHLQPLLDDINDGQFPPPNKLEIAQCLSMCGEGPNMVIYPDNVSFNNLSEDNLDGVIEKALRPISGSG